MKQQARDKGPWLYNGDSLFTKQELRKILYRRALLTILRFLGLITAIWSLSTGALTGNGLATVAGIIVLAVSLLDNSSPTDLIKLKILREDYYKKT